ncbi:MAG: hypothetical protein E7672_06375 [Ruminococcaceae bacterium]|nr:hypothetical protein [Oscillospiraceae bacterium]
MKKFLSLLLVLLMTIGTFTSCSDPSTTDDKVDAEADVEGAQRISMTLSLWLPTSPNTTEEAIEQVSEAINRLTRARYDTAIELHLIPEDEYWETVENKTIEIKERIEAEELAEKERKKKEKEDKLNGVESESATETEPKESEAETIVNDLGIAIQQYPEVGANQMDIILVQGYDNYKKFVDESYLQSLDAELSTTSKILKQYIYPTYFELANYYGVYGVPNNHPASDAEYLLINKELVDEYDYHIDNLQTFVQCGGFIKDIASQNLDGVIPLLSEVEPANIVYCGMNDDWSLISSQLNNTVGYKSDVTPINTLENADYLNAVLLMKELNELGCVGDGTLEDGEKFAVGIVSGDASVIKEYEDEYYCVLHKAPMFEEEDVFGGMFAVSTYSKSLVRAMEIITYLNTNTEFRTVLQYGVEGVHWEYADDNETIIDVISDDYQMNILHTGNAYMTYPGEGIGLDAWSVGKDTNLSAACNPFIGFEGYVTEENQADLEALADLSASVKEQLDNASAAEFLDVVATIKEEISKDATIKKMLNANDENSIVAIYTEFHSDKR